MNSYSSMKLFLEIRQQALLKTAKVLWTKFMFPNQIMKMPEFVKLKALKSMENNKSPGNDGLWKEF